MSETTEKEWLTLKWGTLKGWHLKTDASKDAMRKYLATERSANGCMTQHDTAEQKRLICDIIDALDGAIDNDWTGKEMTKEEAKEYVLTY
jgi:hypothetical protein